MIRIILFLTILLLAGCDDLLERDLTEDKIVVIAPTPDVRMTASEVNFVWEPLKGATAYRVVLVSPSFGNVRQFFADTTVTRCIYTHTLPAGEYQWRIQARNTVFQSNGQVYSFTIVNGDEK